MFSSLICKSCKKETLRKSPAQQYCSLCAKKIASEKQQKRMKRMYHETKEEVSKKLQHTGTETNSPQEHVNMSYSSGTDPLLKKDFGHLLRFWIPYDISLSKNRRWGVTKTGRVYTKDATRKIVEFIGSLVKTSRIKWNINKIYLEIIVQKKNMRGDAINFLDTIADGVKLGLPLDDNWFAVEKIDWEIVKENPKIYISVMQEAIDKYPCRFCGIFQTLDCYGKDVNSKYGITGECKTCLKKPQEIILGDNT